MMISAVDILSDAVLSIADAIGVTTNGIVNSRGEAIMGAGVAKQFKLRFPALPHILGQSLQKDGLCVIDLLDYNGTRIFAFPTKYHWKSQSSLQLIEKSARELVALADRQNWNTIYLPAPGCGLGGLSTQAVFPILDKIFDNRFTICYL